MRVKPSFAAMVTASLLAAAPADSQTARPACPASDPAGLVVLAGLDRHGDLRLADGRIVRLAGLAPRQSEDARDRFADALAPWHGSRFGLAQLGPPDRWGRLPARLVLTEPAAAPGWPDLNAVLLALGVASRLPEPAAAACDDLWRKAEAAAAASLSATGASGRALPLIDGHDGAAVRAQAGRIVIVEGRVASVGERPQRVYLNFERRRGAGGSIVLSRTIWRDMQRGGWTVSTLTGKRVRIRGVVEGQDGLLIAPETRDALDVID